MAPHAADVIEQGQGPRVMLIHSSVSGARQWRALMEDLAGRFHCLAPNLYGYGGTPAWPGPGAQTFLDQAKLLMPLLPADDSPVALVGHSFGATVAMKIAAQLRGRVDRLVLLEPNPIYLLKRYGRHAAYNEAVALRNCIKDQGAKNNWPAAAAVFADYWTGSGSWAAMPESRQAKFAEALKPNYHEWDAALNDREASLSDWAEALPARTTVISAADSPGTIQEVVDLLQGACPHWAFHRLAEGGHMAPLTRPELVNPLLEAALLP